MTLAVHLVPTLVGVGEGDTVVVEGDEAHHAVAVRRVRVGEHVLLTDGAGTSATAEVTATGKRRLETQVATCTRHPRPEPAVTVVQAVPKGDRGELAVEVLTEVGVDRVVPWAAARCVAVWRGEREQRALRRWRATAREAAKQARRSWFPEVTGPAGTGQVADLVREADLALVLHEEAPGRVADLAVPRAGRLLLVVGPEGGLTPEELEELTAAGARPVRLGDEVLRTSTAGLAGVAALLSRTDRW